MSRPRAFILALGFAACLGAGAPAAKPLVAGRVPATLESQASQRTGLNWVVRGGVRVGVEPMPFVTLADVAADEVTAPDALYLSLDEVRLACDLGCLVGRPGGMHVAATDVRFVAPADWQGRSGAVAPKAGEGANRIQMLRLEVRGFGAAIADAGHSVRAVASDVDADLTLAAVPGGRQIIAGLSPSDFTASLPLTRAGTDAEDPSGDALRLTVQSRTSEAPLLVANGRADRARPLRFEVTDGAIAGAPFAARDGALDGLDRAGLLTTAQRAGPPGAGGQPLATPFSAAQGSFDVAGGQATTIDLKLTTSLLTVTGVETIDLVDHSLDLHFKPSIGGSAAGAINPLAIMLLVTGPRSQPSMTADVSEVAVTPSRR